MFLELIIVILVCLLIYYFNKQTLNKYVCMYAYYEKDHKYKENLIYFLENGVLENIDYYIIINGECTVDIPNLKNIKVIKRENTGHDFGAWNHCINNYIKRQYDYYIFINTSVRGPYLRHNKNLKTNWLDEFLKLFNNNDIKLVGTSINIFTNNSKLFNEDVITKTFLHKGPYTHIQSMFFILNKDGFEFLKNDNFFNSSYDDFFELILNKEIGMTQRILKNEWNINCILSKYRNHDYRKVKKNFNPSSEDPYFEGSYFGGSINPYEVIFYKNNRK